jgi:predicted nucleic acid-binding protein
LFNVMVRKAGWSKRDATERISAWRRLGAPYDPDPDGILRAAQLAADHDLQIWDAVIVATAASAGCTILASEDMQHDFFWNGLTIVNPFRSPSHPLLVAAMNPTS